MAGEGTYGNAYQTRLSASSGGAGPGQYKIDVNRTKTRKWVEAKTQSYDGDDWGADEFDYESDETVLGAANLGSRPKQTPPPSSLPLQVRTRAPDTGSPLFRRVSPADSGRGRSGPDPESSPTSRRVFDGAVPSSVEPTLGQASAASPKAATSVTTRLWPRKSSIEQQEWRADPAQSVSSSTTASPRQNMADPAKVGSVFPAGATRASVKSSGAASKPLSLTRPSETHRRTSVDHEQRSMESRRPSGDGGGRIGDGGMAWPITAQETAGATDARKKTGLSECGLEGLLDMYSNNDQALVPGPPMDDFLHAQKAPRTDLKQARQQKDPMPTPPRPLPHEQAGLGESGEGDKMQRLRKMFSQSRMTPDPRQAQEIHQKRLSTSPKLPDLSRMSGFGTDLFSGSTFMADETPSWAGPTCPVPTEAKESRTARCNSTPATASLTWAGADTATEPTDQNTAPPLSTRASGPKPGSKVAAMVQAMNSRCNSPTKEPMQTPEPSPSMRPQSSGQAASPSPIQQPSTAWPNEAADKAAVGPFFPGTRVIDTDANKAAGKVATCTRPSTATSDLAPIVSLKVKNSSTGVAEALDMAAPHCLGRTSTIDTASSSPAKESDQLRQEIINALLPVPEGNFCAATSLGVSAELAGDKPAKSVLSASSSLTTQGPVEEADHPAKQTISDSTKAAPDDLEQGLRRRFSWETESPGKDGPEQQQDKHQANTGPGTPDHGAAPAPKTGGGYVKSSMLDIVEPKAETESVSPRTCAHSPIEPVISASLVHSDKVLPASPGTASGTGDDGVQGHAAHDEPLAGSNKHRRSTAPEERVRTFKEIMRLDKQTERIDKLCAARMHYAAVETGLEAWMVHLKQKHAADHANTSALLLTSIAAKRPVSGASKGSAGSGGGSRPGSGASNGGLVKVMPLPPGFTGSKHNFTGVMQSRKEVGAKSKELFMAAGKAGKGLFSKGKNKLRGAGGG